MLAASAAKQTLSLTEGNGSLCQLANWWTFAPIDLADPEACASLRKSLYANSFGA